MFHAKRSLMQCKKFRHCNFMGCSQTTNYEQVFCGISLYVHNIGFAVLNSIGYIEHDIEQSST